MDDGQRDHHRDGLLNHTGGWHLTHPATQIKEVRWWVLNHQKPGDHNCCNDQEGQRGNQERLTQGKLRRWLIAHDVHRGKINGHLTRMMLNIYYKEKQTWRARRLRAIPLIKSHDLCSVSYLSLFSDPELIGAEMAVTLEEKP